MNELCAMNGHYRFYQLETFFEKVSSIGFKKAEIWTGPHHYFMDYQGYEDVNKLKRLEKAYGVKIEVICPEQTNPKPNNMAAKDPQAIKRVEAYFKHAIDVASQIDAKLVLVTSGWAFLDEDVNEAFKRSVQMMRKLVAYAESKHIRLAIEALQKDESRLVNSISSLQSYLQAVDHDNLYVCIDFGAMAGANETLDDYFKAFGKKIAHVHFVDGKPVGHLAWSDGTRDMKADLETLQKYGYEGLLSLESVNNIYFEKPFEADQKTMNQYQVCSKE
ncbi:MULTISPECIES: sugar phosphate isomerase/epimerase family protein [unclassified Breznakia]|uniref:sugar phosphate isomerase/epimerase family protein n=1 Tax=unclassified Breznakia TaxID=2623764 RepID=UPI0024764333|nr:MULTISPECIES: sugar phosphate isomerase/epimerase family protein [unclassified Breznakia]MDH6367950.1 protein FrlC [Breznakia sp. PH1-1]MDH6405038.1 protein FrlC [Breznakia sp. PF1-11]MDH6412753.1 protein FrlC [Breznakia sp. PFB1-11]MDH6415110.1 protein FrlC [Breznakia sp. PFB1-14]MDH6417424.1 protein FrlC [Breznakia sp. PFB1-4]